MKKWKIIRTITLIILICFIIFAGCLLINAFLKGNFYSDVFGVTIFYWYKHFFVAMGLYLYILGIPLLVDLIIFIISTIKIKNIIKNKY